MQKLGLKTKKHPSPYCLVWLKIGNKATIPKHCLISFSIGSKYWNKVWYDLVAMDACHLLLGRP